MAMFLADIAFAFELIAIGFGFVLLYLFKKESIEFLRWGGLVLVIGGFLGVACTSYYTFKFHFQDDFRSAYPSMLNGCSMQGCSMKDKGECMMHGMMMDKGDKHNNMMEGDHKGHHHPNQ